MFETEESIKAFLYILMAISFVDKRWDDREEQFIKEKIKENATQSGYFDKISGTFEKEIENIKHEFFKALSNLHDSDITAKIRKICSTYFSKLNKDEKNTVINEVEKLIKVDNDEDKKELEILQYLKEM